jgi:septal ring factor EnvC (AmiA/AmiB activator)
MVGLWYDSFIMDFLARAEDDRRQLQEQIERLDAGIAQLQEQRAALGKRLDAAQVAVDYYRSLMAETSDGSSPSDGVAVRAPQEHETVADAVAKALRVRGGTARAVALHKDLLRAGHDVSYTTVNNALNGNKDRFTKVFRGVFRLSELGDVALLQPEGSHRWSVSDPIPLTEEEATTP